MHNQRTKQREHATLTRVHVCMCLCLCVLCVLCICAYVHFCICPYKQTDMHTPALAQGSEGGSPTQNEPAAALVKAFPIQAADSGAAEHAFVGARTCAPLTCFLHCSPRTARTTPHAPHHITPPLLDAAPCPAAEPQSWSPLCTANAWSWWRSWRGAARSR